MSSPLTPREKGMAALVVHLLAIILVLVWPELPWVKAAEAQRLKDLEAQELVEQQENPRFVFMDPKVEMKVPPPQRAELSDLDRRASAPERAVDPKNAMPFARGNTTEKVVADNAGPRERPEASTPPAGGENGEAARELPPLPEANNGVVLKPETPKPQMRGPSSGVLSDAIRNLSKYAGQETFNNQQGGTPDANYPFIQFDAKGVEFGPWLRRFIAQIKRNWFIPYAAMTMKGHVVVTFYVHKDGRITDLAVRKPSSVTAFTNSSFNAIAASNPTLALPPEYPDDKALFTITFYYNETPDR